MIEFPSAAADRAVLAALEEDAAACDLTTQRSVPDGLVSEATIISRAHGIIAGLQMVDLVSTTSTPASVLALPRRRRHRETRRHTGSAGLVSGAFTASDQAPVVACLDLGGSLAARRRYRPGICRAARATVRAAA